MALERILPRYDASERHAIVVRADAARTYAALRTLDLADLPLTRVLMAVRALPDRVLGRRGPLPEFVVAGVERRGLPPEALAIRTLYLARSDPLGLTSDEHLRLRVHLEVAPPGRVAILARIGRDDRVAGALGHVLQRDAL